MTPNSPWDDPNPATLEALINTHVEDYVEDVDFMPFIRAWKADRELLERAAPFVEAAKESPLTDAAWSARARAWLSELRDAV